VYVYICIFDDILGYIEKEKEIEKKKKKLNYYLNHYNASFLK
jgi:hypothetical protein